LKKTQLAIANILQENKELRQQLAAKTLEVLASQGREGNMTWIKRQLIEAQDTITQLRKTQRLLEERNVKHFIEREVTGEKVRAALASMQKKHD
jgi:ribosomal protein S28E/S33